MPRPKSLKNEIGPPDGYIAIGVYKAGSDSASLLAASNRQIILFDTKLIAQQFLPLLGLGRSYIWGADGESIFFLPIDPTGVNHYDILTGYDPYNLPPGMPDGIRSETKGREWKHHIHWAHVFTDCGQYVRQPDGTLINTAIEG